jgi:hypothetical protein
MFILVFLPVLFYHIFKMNYIKGVVFAAGLGSSLGLAERTIDPFDRHEYEYTIDGPQQRSDVFYVSVNGYDEHDNKHDDRLGDGLLMLTIAAGLGSLLLKTELARAPQPDDAI